MLKSVIFITVMALQAGFAEASERWAETLGGPKPDTFGSLLSGSDDDVFVSGETQSYGYGNGDVWLLKVGPDGNVLTQRTYGDASTESGSFRTTSDGGFVCAGATMSSRGMGRRDRLGDLWVLRTDGTGKILWQRSYGGSGADGANDIRQTTDGGFIVVGQTQSFGSGGWDGWVLRLTSTGNVVWQKALGGKKDDMLGSVRTTADGGFIVAGTTESYGAGSSDAWLLKLTSSGRVDLQKTFGGPQADGGCVAGMTSDGGYLLTAHTSSFGAGEQDAWVLKLKNTGSVVWQMTYGGPKNDWVGPYRIHEGKSYLLTGFSESYGHGQSDAWLFNINDKGKMIWQRTYGGTGQDWGGSVTTLDGGDLLLAGYTDSFGAGDSDGWLIRTGSTGDPGSSCASLVGTSTAKPRASAALVANSKAKVTATKASPKNTHAKEKSSSASKDVLCHSFE